jgi:NAD(P)-dependent dehydrogenase (short-subunit alcohol dehydrogenase family)
MLPRGRDAAPDMDISSHLTASTVLVVGGSSGIAARIAADAAAAGADTILAGRDASRLAADGARTETVDLTDEASIAALAERVGPVDHLVVTAAAHANGPVATLERDAVHRAFDAKVVGPLLLAKHLTVRRSILLFSGVAAWRPAPGLSVMVATNGAVAFLAEALAVELAPVRVNAISPGIVDSGVWDADVLADTAARLPAGRTGTPADVSAAAFLALTNPFVTGTTLHVDGGGRLG